MADVTRAKHIPMLKRVVTKESIITMSHIEKTFTPDFLSKYIVFDFQNNIYVYFDKRDMTVHLTISDSDMMDRFTLSGSEQSPTQNVFEKLLMKVLTQDIAGRSYEKVMQSLLDASHFLCLAHKPDMYPLLSEHYYSGVVLYYWRDTCYFFNEEGVWSECKFEEIRERGLKVWDGLCPQGEGTTVFTLGKSSTVVPEELLWCPKYKHTVWREVFIFKRLKLGSTVSDYLKMRSGRVAWARMNSEGHMKSLMLGYNEWAIRSLIGRISDPEVNLKPATFSKKALESVTLEVYLTSVLGEQTFDFVRNNIKLVHGRVYRHLKEDTDLNKLGVTPDMLRLKSVNRHGKTIFYELVPIA